MKSTDLLPDNHPSREAGNAVFVFQTVPLKGTGTVITVYASDCWQVAILERLLLRSGQVSPYIRVLAVIRDVRDFGTRNDTHDIPLYEFLRDCVDPERILSDPMIREALSKTFGDSVEDAVDHREDDSPRPVDDKALKILTELGFDKEFSLRTLRNVRAANTAEAVKLSVAEMVQ